MLFWGLVLCISELSTAWAGDLSGYVALDTYKFCPIERYEPVLQTSCLWDASAQAVGNCDQPQYQEVVGRRPIYQACQTLLALSERGPMPANPYPELGSTDAKVWRLMKALQPIAVEAVKIISPACVSSVKPPSERKSKADFEYYFSCLDEVDVALKKQTFESSVGKILSAVEAALLRADFDNPQTVAASSELTLLLEDDGTNSSLQTVEEILDRFK